MMIRTEPRWDAPHTDPLEDIAAAMKMIQRGAEREAAIQRGPCPVNPLCQLAGELHRHGAVLVSEGGASFP